MNESSTHRVSAVTEQALRLIIKEKTKDAKIRQEYERFDAQYKLAKNTGSKRYTTYENLFVLLDCLQVSLKEFLQKNNATPEYLIKWATPEQEKMCSYLDAMTEKQKEKMLQYINALMPMQIADALAEYDNSEVYGERLTAILAASRNDDSACLKTFTQLGIEAKWRQNKQQSIRYTILPHEYIPAIATIMKLSHHWLLNCGDRPVLASTASTEKVMDRFCFLPENYQTDIEEGMKLAVMGRGLILG